MSNPRWRPCCRALLLISLFAGLATHADPAKDVHWPTYRGTQAGGIARGFSTPTSWDVESSKNVLWTTPIPGLGHSSPVIWGDRLFVTSAVSGKAKSKLKVGLYGDIAPVKDDTVHRWEVYCLDKKTGEILWRRTAHEGVPKIRRHTKSTHANSTPATDGKHVVVFFGSEGLHCYDMDGKLLWKKDLGVLDSGYFKVPSAQWGFGSSPVIHGDAVIVQCDTQEHSFLAAFNIKNGQELWRTPRDEVPTWSTPTVHTVGKDSRILVNGYKQIGGYDVATGAEIWSMRGGGDIPVPTPIVAHDLVFITNAHGGGAPIYAVRVDARGDLSSEAEGQIAWSHAQGGAYMQTPLVYGDYLYSCRDNGILSCYEAKTGELVYRNRIGRGSSGFTASAVAADGKIYYTSETGRIHVVKAGPEFEILAENEMDEICMATPAISEGVLFFRTRTGLIAIGERAGKK